MANVCGVPWPEAPARMCKENYRAAKRKQRQDTEHKYLMESCPEYRAACIEEDRDRARRVESMNSKMEITRVDIAGVTEQPLGRTGRNGRVTEPKVGEYKGHPTLTLPNGSKYGFTFGISKAHAILDNLEAIRAFIGDITEEVES